MRRAAAFALAALLAACASAPPPRPGAYYSDDGPPEGVPEGLAALPDAVPREEPYHRFANRPYTVFGKTYVPVLERTAGKERGLASWYGKKFHGQKTASGEVYDMFKMTAAHKTLPLPSFVRVTNVRSGQSVVVRVNDRGPFHDGRIIDLSYAAAQRIGIVQSGSGLVEVERVYAGDAAKPVDPPPRLETAREEGLWLQLGAFSTAEAAEGFRDRSARAAPWLLEPFTVALVQGLHRVRLGPYRNRDEAQAIADKLRQTLGVAPVITAR